MTSEKKPIVISACLLGVPCRYDGQSKPCEAALALAREAILIPVCPEQLGGLPTPRSKAERRGERVVNCEGDDVTSSYRRGAEQTLHICQLSGCDTAILKEKSPSCGCGAIYDGSFSGKLLTGHGVTAALLLENGIRVIGESGLAAWNTEGEEV